MRMSRRELKSLVEDSNGRLEGHVVGRWPHPIPARPRPSGQNSRDVEALSCRLAEAAKNEELLKLQLQELEGNAEISRMKLEQQSEF